MSANDDNLMILGAPRRAMPWQVRCGFRGWGRSGTCLALFLLFGGLGPISGIIPYVFVPGFTVAFFNGEPSPTANFWCSLTASADLTVSFLCLSALFSASLAVKQLAVRSFFVYAASHFGIFWFWSFHGNALPMYWNFVLPSAILLALAALVLWGVPHPLKAQQRQIWPLVPDRDRAAAAASQAHDELS
jgi:hypothetical protein